MSKGKTVAGKLEKEDVLKAILIADDFDELFSPFLQSDCSAFLPIATKRIIEYSLEWLSYSGVQETVLFCSTKADIIKDYVKTLQWSAEGSGMKLTVMVSESCMSFGDALRDIDNKAIIKSDFILLTTSTVASFELQDVLKEHVAQCKKDRGTAMTLILQDRGCTAAGKETIVGLNSVDKRLVLYNKNATESKIELSLECIGENPQLTLCSTLRDAGVAICSPSVPLLFSDNFDFQTKQDFIRGLLMNEEILASRIYCHVVSGYCQAVSDWPTYQRVSMDILNRWTYPLVPDFRFGKDEPLTHHRGNIYKHPGVNLSKGCKLNGNVAIGRGSTFGSNVRMLRCVVGSDCVIGDDVTLQDTFIMNNVTIKDGSSIKLSVIGEDVNVGSKSSINNCQLRFGVRLNNGSKLQDRIIAKEKVDDSCEKLGESAFALSTAGEDSDSEGGGDVGGAMSWLVDPDAVEQDLYESDSASEADESRPASPEADDCTMFYNEVVDSLQRGFEEKLPCGNLILEINSSRYAYNVTLEEVTQLTCKAVFALPGRLNSPIKPLLVYFKPLFANYVKTDSGQRECLSAFEEMHLGLGSDLNGCIHFLYDTDVLSEENITKWFEELEDETLKSKLQKFVTWLEEAAEESDDD